MFKRLKNIEDKNKEQLEAIEDHGKKQLDADSKSLKSVIYFSQLRAKANCLRKLKKKKNDIDPEKFVCVKTDGTVFNFNKYKNSIDLVLRIYTNNNLLKDAENEQYDIKILLNKLKKIKKKIKARRETLSATEKLLNNRQENIDSFKTGIFPYIDRFPTKEESEEESEKKLIRKNKR